MKPDRKKKEAAAEEEDNYMFLKEAEPGSASFISYHRLIRAGYY
jgi:hypothetical protein